MNSLANLLKIFFWQIGMPQYCKVNMLNRSELTRHNDIYYKISDAQMNAEIGEDYVPVICDRLVTQIEEILGYTFLSGRASEKTSRGENDELSEDDKLDDELPSYATRLYRCSQDKTLACYSKAHHDVRPRKRRRREVQERYHCCGRIRIYVATDSKGANIQVGSERTIHLEEGQLLVRFNHKCGHPPRLRKPVPKSVRSFIMDPANASRTSSEMYRKVLHASETGVLKDVDMVEITDDNVRYWWIQRAKLEYQTDEDPWISAVAYLRTKPNTSVHSFIENRRRYFLWFFPGEFDIDLTTVTEIYIDSTHGTNGQNAELFGIIACEEGWGVPVGYMVVEKMPTEDSKRFPGEVIEACTKFFQRAKGLGLNPIIVHTDKCPAELAAIKVIYYLRELTRVG